MFCFRSICCSAAVLLMLSAPVPAQNAPAKNAPAQDLSVQSKDGVTTITHNGKPLLEYRSEPHPNKLYVARWYTPNGVQILRDSPHDHPHHHALMYAIGIDDVDFWAEVPPEAYGRQLAHDLSTESSTTSDEHGKRGETTIKQHVQWVDPKGNVLAEEARTLQAQFGVVPGASLLTWQCTLRGADDKDAIKLWGRHYFGLGMRFVESMDKGSEFVMPLGTKSVAVRGSEKLTRASWCAVHGNANGKPITVAMFDAPDNPRHPATWFTMTSGFAYLAATLDLHEKPISLAQDKELKLRYGIAAWDGTVDREAIEEAYQQWLKSRG